MSNKKKERKLIFEAVGKECSKEKLVDLFWGIILENIESGIFMNHIDDSSLGICKKKCYNTTKIENQNEVKNN